MIIIDFFFLLFIIYLGIGISITIIKTLSKLILYYYYHGCHVDIVLATIFIIATTIALISFVYRIMEAAYHLIH